MVSDPLTVAEAAQIHLADLAAHAEKTDVAIVLVVYRGKWAQFDLSTMEAKYLSPAELFDRHLTEALAAVDLTRASDKE